MVALAAGRTVLVVADSYVASVTASGPDDDIAWLHVRLLAATRGSVLSADTLVPGGPSAWSETSARDAAFVLGHSPDSIEANPDEAEQAWERFECEFVRLWDVVVSLFETQGGRGLQASFVASDRPPADVVRRLSALLPTLTFTFTYAASGRPEAGHGLCRAGRWLAGEQLTPDRWDLNELIEPPEARIGS